MLEEYQRFRTPDDKEFEMTYHGPTGYGIGGRSIGCMRFLQNLNFSKSFTLQRTYQLTVCCDNIIDQKISVKVTYFVCPETQCRIHPTVNVFSSRLLTYNSK